MPQHQLDARRIDDVFIPEPIEITNSEFRESCRIKCALSPNMPRLKTIAAVGVYCAEIGGSDVDSQRLTAALTYCLRSGILIDPDFEIDIVNFRDRRNFLTETSSIDLVFISNILNKRLKGTFDITAETNMPEGTSFRAFYGFGLSKGHGMSDWVKRIEQSGAKLVVTFGGCLEIGTHDLSGFNGAQQVPLIETPETSFGLYNEIITPKKDQLGGYQFEPLGSLKEIYGERAEAYDLPMPWLGISASPDYIEQLSKAFGTETALTEMSRVIRAWPHKTAGRQLFLKADTKLAPQF